MKIIISAAGTGGHVIPALQLAKQLKNCDIVFLGKGLSTNRNFEKIFDFHEIESVSLRNKKFVYSLCKGFFQSLIFFKKFKPDIIVGFGSYYTFPVLMAAYLLRKPIAIFEPNIEFGKVNRFFFKKAKIVAKSFENDYKSIPVNPLPWGIKKKNLDYKKELGLLDVFTILIFGGSQGARSIDEIFCKSIGQLEKNFQVIHISQNTEEISLFYKKIGIRAYVVSYEKNMEKLYLSCDLAVCRSGAATISELVFFNIPSILIPLPSSSKDHQLSNALFMAKSVKGAILFREEIDNKKFSKLLSELTLKNKRYMEMKQNLLNFQEKIKKENRKNFSDLILNI